MNGWLRAEQATGFRVLWGEGERQPCIMVLMYNTTWNKKGFHPAPVIYMARSSITEIQWSSTDLQEDVLIYTASSKCTSKYHIVPKMWENAQISLANLLWNHRQMNMFSEVHKIYLCRANTRFTVISFIGNDQVVPFCLENNAMAHCSYEITFLLGLLLLTDLMS